MPRRVDLDVRSAGCQVASQAHTYARFGAHQLDRARVHPAQGRAVDGQLRLGAAVVGQGGGRQGLSVDVVAAGDHGDVFRVQLGVDFRATGDDLELIKVIGVQPRALDADAAALHVEVVELAIVQHRFAGSQGHPWSIDEAATVAGNAIGVSDDDARRLAGHFRVAVEL